MKKIVTLGELMVRLTPPSYKRIIQTETLEFVFGGGEANVAVSLANFKDEVYFVSKLPKHEVGEAAVMSLKKHGVNTDYIVRGGERIGIYYLENGASLRASKVIYDRSHSAISEADVKEFDFDKIFSDASWFHITGITPAISDKGTELTIKALEEAKKHNVTVSMDLNYRSKLWSEEKAQKVMTKIMKYVDVMIGNEEDAQKCLGVKVKGNNVECGKLDIDGYKEMFKELHNKFSFKYIATSLRESHSASDNGWSGIIYDGTNYYKAKDYNIHIVDRVGGGDSFAAGLIHSFINNKQMEEALEFAVAASALKQTIPGDYNMVNEDDVNKLLTGGSSGRVQR